MNRTKNQKHNWDTFSLGLSRMFERASYYGVRALILLYMVEETLKMEDVEAATIYGWFVGYVLFSQILGALLGDLIIGNRKSIIIGGVLQAIGAFSLCIPTTNGLYVGLFLIVLGNGLYTPNIISNFGKLYLGKIRLLDSGFTLFYLMINLGSLLGVVLLGYFVSKYDFKIGFVMSGILMLFSIVLVLTYKEKEISTNSNYSLSLSKRILNITIILILVSLFWGIYEISDIRILGLQRSFSEISTLNIPKNLWQSTSTIFIFPIGIFAIILWSYFYNSQIFKLLLGFIFAIISFGILFLIPKIPTEQHTTLYLLSLLFLGISEIHLAPIVHSTLTQYANPKYLAILVSLAFIPTKLFVFLFSLFNEKFYDDPILGLKFGIISSTVVGAGLVTFLLVKRKNYLQQRL